jgi:hypothetical protein
MRQRLYGDTFVDFHIRKFIINRNARFVDSCNSRMNMVSHRIIKTLGRSSCPDYTMIRKLANSRPSYLAHDLFKFSGEGFEVDRVIDRAFDEDRFLQ